MSDLMPILTFTGYEGGKAIRKMIESGATEIIVALPMAMLKQHEPQAISNHGQTLQRLWERGGLGVEEAVLILTDSKLRWDLPPLPQAHRKLKELLDAFRASNERTAPCLPASKAE